MSTLDHLPRYTSPQQAGERLLELLSSLQSAVVAFSGGVDSTLLLAATVEALGPSAVLAVTAVSPTQPSGEHERAIELARQLGARLRSIATRELEHPAFVHNPPDRCYHCKTVLFTAICQAARAEGFAAVLEGSNRDDVLHDHRPGLRAVRELGVRSPLAELGLSKQAIRELLRLRGLPGWDRPAMACLASRFPYGEAITVERLQQVDRAEQALRALGFVQVRVRHHGSVARIETAPQELSRLLDPELRRQAALVVRAAGFRYVACDLEGYRTGAMNEGLDRRSGGGARELEIE